MTLMLSLSTLFGQLNTWETQTTGTTESLHGVAFVSSTTGWAVGDNGTILKSTSAGVNWAPQPSGTSEPLESVFFIDSLHGWVVGGCDGCGGGIILKTTDGGASWATKDTGRILASVDFVSPAVGWAVGFNGLILKTTDAGETWNTQVTDVISCLESVYFIDASTGWASGLLPGALLTTTDGGSTWTSQTNGVDQGEDIDAVHFVDHQTGWYVGYGFDTAGVGVIKKSTDGGVTWAPQASNVSQSLLALGFINATTGWAAGSAGTLLKTTNGGGVWAPESSGTFLELDDIDVRPGQGAWIAGGSGNVIRNNFGPLLLRRAFSLNDLWNLVSIPLAGVNGRKNLLFPTATSPAFAYAPGAGYLLADTLLVGVGYWEKFSGAQTVSVAGTSIDSLTVSLTPPWNLVGGITREVSVGSLIQIPPGSIQSVFGYNGSYFSATTIKPGQGYWMRCSQNCTVTFRSTADPNTPRAMLTDVSRLRTDELPPPAPGEIRAAAPRKSLPVEYGLGQNYPNPFNPATRINFDLPEESMVDLSITNTLGQTVAVLLHGTVAAGYQSVEWKGSSADGAQLPSGVYIYRIRASSLSTGKEFQQVKKLVLMK
jgi:photosystem II stability/assembly factor-like uncharacterized protein